MKRILFFVFFIFVLMVQGCCRFLTYNLLVTRSKESSDTKLYSVNSEILCSIRDTCLSNGLGHIEDVSHIPAEATVRVRANYVFNDQFFAYAESGWISAVVYHNQFSIYVEIVSWGVDSADKKLYDELFDELSNNGLGKNVSIMRWKGYSTDDKLNQKVSK